MSTITRLMAGAALALVMTAPVYAQDAEAPAGDAVVGEEAAPGTQSGEATDQSNDPAATDTDDDDDEEAAAEEGGGVYEAGGMHEYGFSGLLDRQNRTDLAPLTLASGQPVAGGEYTIKSGGYYRIEINADGSQELALSGGDFFRAIWINEFDSAGTARLSFIAVLPGRYTLSVPGSSGDTLQAVFNIQ